jgi:hypothetical protein
MRPWYLRPTPLKIIARLRANPPQRRINDSTNPLTTTAAYVGFDALALRDQFKKVFKQVYEAVPYNAEAASALMQTSADEVLAAMFGCPDGLDQLMPDAYASRIKRRAAIAAEIEAALNMQVAA